MSKQASAKAKVFRSIDPTRTPAFKQRPRQKENVRTTPPVRRQAETSFPAM